jgi:hypothetical protein
MKKLGRTTAPELSPLIRVRPPHSQRFCPKTEHRTVNLQFEKLSKIKHLHPDFSLVDEMPLNRVELSWMYPVGKKSLASGLSNEFSSSLSL